jgi:hypothetical protein
MISIFPPPLFFAVVGSVIRNPRSGMDKNLNSGFGINIATLLRAKGGKVNIATAALEA